MDLGHHTGGIHYVLQDGLNDHALKYAIPKRKIMAVSDHIDVAGNRSKRFYYGAARGRLSPV